MLGARLNFDQLTILNYHQQPDFGTLLVLNISQCPIGWELLEVSEGKTP